MSSSMLKAAGIGCFVVCAILLFVAWERYQDNVNQVEAAKRLMGALPYAGIVNQARGEPKLEPAIPPVTKYAIFFAALAGVGGVACVVFAVKKSLVGSTQATPP
jgi:hypothetical protein